MHLIGTIAATAGPAVASLGGQLPWAWFALMAVADITLAVVLVGRRRASRLDAAKRVARASRSDSLVLRNGWQVPRSRALRVQARPATYAWPLHTEYMVSRLV